MLLFRWGHMHSWACNLKNIAPQKQNANWKTRVQYAKRNRAFELFKAHCAATINAQERKFLQQKNLRRKKRNCNFINKILHGKANSNLRKFRTPGLQIIKRWT
jgi:hypothetical protein